MILSEEYKKRIQKLSGIISEDKVTLTATSGGRSDVRTLSWYAEEYLLKLGSDIITQLDDRTEENSDNKLFLSKSETKIMPNSLVIKLIIEENKIKHEFLLTLSVSLETNSNTVCAIKYKSIINKFNLNSKHSSSDLKTFKSEIIENIFNSIKLSQKV